MVGNVTAESLLIAMGAVFRGQSFMGSEEDTAEEMPEPLAEQRPAPSRRRSAAAAAAAAEPPEAETEAEAE